MNKEKLSKKYNSLVYNHLWLKFVIEYGYATIISAISALLFALAVGLFIKPTSVDIEMVSGGASGFSQVLSKSLELLHIKEPANLPSFYSIFYLLTNVPLIILAFKCIGKRFAIFTLVNVFLVFLFVNFINGGIFDAIGSYVNEKGGGLIARALFAGLFTGLSSALAYTIDSSAGGFDILSYYISQKKSTSIGKYTVAINFAIMVSFAVVSSIYKINIDGATNKLEVWAQGLSGIFYSSIYLITVMLVVDVINVRNKKAKVEIITSKPNLAQLLLANIPHGATVTEGKGAYTGNDKFVVTIVVSTLEVKKVVKVVKQLDPCSFIDVTTLQQVYGSFHIKRVK